MTTILLHNLPHEILEHILACIGSYGRSKTCTVSKLFEKVSLAVSKCVSPFPHYYDPSQFNDILRKRHERYYDNNDERIAADLQFRDMSHQIIRQNDYHLIVRLKSMYIAHQLEFACKIGYIPIIDLCLLHGKKSYWDGLYGACEGGHLRVVEMMLDKVKIKNKSFKHAYYCAGINGNREIIDMLRQYAVRYNDNYTFDNYDAEFVLTGACKGGHLELVDWAIEQGAIEFEEGFTDACEHDHLPIIKLLFESTEHNHELWPSLDDTILSEGIATAAGKGFSHIVDYLVERAQLGPIYQIDWSWVLQRACTGKQDYMIKYAIDHGATRCEGCYESIESHVHEK